MPVNGRIACVSRGPPQDYATITRRWSRGESPKPTGTVERKLLHWYAIFLRLSMSKRNVCPLVITERILHASLALPVLPFVVQNPARSRRSKVVDESPRDSIASVVGSWSKIAPGCRLCPPSPVARRVSFVETGSSTYRVFLNAFGNARGTGFQEQRLSAVGYTHGNVNTRSGCWRVGVDRARIRTHTHTHTRGRARAGDTERRTLLLASPSYQLAQVRHPSHTRTP